MAARILQFSPSHEVEGLKKTGLPRVLKFHITHPFVETPTERCELSARAKLGVLSICPSFADWYERHGYYKGPCGWDHIDHSTPRTVRSASGEYEWLSHWLEGRRFLRVSGLWRDQQFGAEIEYQAKGTYRSFFCQVCGATRSRGDRRVYLAYGEQIFRCKGCAEKLLGFKRGCGQYLWHLQIANLYPEIKSDGGAQ